MIKKIIAIIILITVVLFFFWGESKQDLGDSYYYLPKYEAIDVGYPGGAIIYKSQQKYLFSDIKISGNIIDVNSNDNFVLAVQKLDNLNIETDSLQYFIIVKKTDLMYGPFNSELYLQTRINLEIPKKLNLEIN